jgi:aerobic-type carbon monoxide dehydrogenase small subunit (CoxS/CutS family)
VPESRTIQLVDLACTVNGRNVALRIEPRETLADVLRERLGLTGTKVSCDAQVCGACTVLLDGQPVSSCTLLAVEASGRAVRTVEGLARDGSLTPLQEAFIEHAAFQCGFCTSGVAMTLAALLRRPDLRSEAEIREFLSGTLCRCTGYGPILEAAKACVAVAG